MKEEKPTKVLDREEKNKAGEERTILKEDIKIREICAGTSFEIDIPGSVLASLNVHSEKGSVRFVEENGRVYLERSGGVYLKEAQREKTKAEEIIDLDGIDFRTTKEGKKLLLNLLDKHNKLNHLEKKIEETDNLTVIEVGEIHDILLEGWLPEIGIFHSENENAKIYIMQVGNHLEIGKAEINCIE